MKRHRRANKPVAEINLTSLLDVTFVLLIAFMIISPSVKYGVEVNLPTMQQGAPQIESSEANVATITIAKSMVVEPGSSQIRMFMLDGELLELDALEKQLRERNLAAQGKLAVEIQADRDIPYDSFVQVVGALRRAGIEGIGLPVETQSQ